MPTITMDSVVRRNLDIVFTDMDGEIVMLGIEQSAYYGLNDIGSRIWQLLEHDMSVQELCRILNGEYDVSDAQCRSDVQRFLQELLNQQLVHVR